LLNTFIIDYSLTEYGKGLVPLLESMHTWGLAHLQHLDELYRKNKKSKGNKQELYWLLFIYPNLTNCHLTDQRSKKIDC
jgi:hypothetical protein